MLLLAVLIIFIGTGHLASAQSFGSEWGNPELLFSSPKGEKTNELWVVRGVDDRIYSLWNFFPVTSEETQETTKSAVLLAQWTNGRWQGPNDILVWPEGGRLTSTVVDKVGTLHAFSATDCISYSHARWYEAISAQNWSERQCIDATGLTNPSATIGPDGAIFVVYAGKGTKALRLINSTNNGKSWSIISTIDETTDGFLIDPAMAIDDKGRLHVVWSIGSPPNGYPPQGVYYSRSDNDGQTWKLPIQLSGIDEGEPAIAVYQDEIHVLWNGDAKKQGRYYRYSSDAGETWDPTITLSPQATEGGDGGLQKPPSITADNTGTVHMLLHEQEDLYYIAKTGKEWTDKELMFAASDFNSREIREPRLVITGGNQLHAFYIIISYTQSPEEDAIENVSRIYHQIRSINSTQEDPILFPTPLAPEISITSEPIDEVPTPHATSEGLFTSYENSIESQNPSTFLILSASLVLLFISLVFVYTRLRK